MSEQTANNNATTSQAHVDDEWAWHAQEQADVIHDLAGLLAHDLPGDDRFWRFQAMAFHAANAFGDFPDVNLLESIRTDSGRQELLSNPAAAPLLAYFVIALQRFNSEVSWDDLADATTDKRCRLLANAFGLLGKQGERRPQLGAGGSFGSMFGHLVQMAARASGLPEGVPLPERDREAVRLEALKCAYRARHGAEFNSAHPDDKEKMRKLRKDLAEHGWDVSP